MEQIKEARWEHLTYQTWNTRKTPKPCLSISKLRSALAGKNARPANNESSPYWSFGMVYPKEARRIWLHQEMDIHSLIGNIGGYIGLFVGMWYKCYALISNPKFLF